jgi:hypothetical protein
MGLYNFKSQFVEPILAGDKTHTIRATRANPDKPGNMLHLYTGLRHKGARLLMRAECTRVEHVTISALSGRIMVDGELLDDGEQEQLARRDGFKSHYEMMQFWHGRLPFEGHIIHWKGQA